MKYLAVDTSTRTAVIALGLSSDDVLEAKLDSSEVHSSKLLPGIQALLARAGAELRDIGYLGVVTGPGSFTGIRVGIAAMKGISWSLKIPLVGLNALEALVLSHPKKEGLFCPLIDARRGRVYTALYQRHENVLQELRPPSENTIDGALAQVSGSTVIIGSGGQLYAETIRSKCGEKVEIAEMEYNAPRAETLIYMTKAIQKSGNGAPPPQPLYLSDGPADRVK